MVAVRGEQGLSLPADPPPLGQGCTARLVSSPELGLVGVRPVADGSAFWFPTETFGDALCAPGGGAVGGGGRPRVSGPGAAEAGPDCLFSPLAESTAMVSPASSEAQVLYKQTLHVKVRCLVYRT